MNERQKNFAGKEIFDVVESFLKGKHAETDNEDAIFINPAFAAVIDGATSKSDFRKNGKTTGQWAVQCVMEALQGLSVEATCLEAVSAITARIRNFYLQCLSERNLANRRLPLFDSFFLFSE